MTVERTALVVTTRAAESATSNGATLRREEIVALLKATGYRVDHLPLYKLNAHHPNVDLTVAISYACSGALRHMVGRAGRTWLDAVDSWLLVNSSGLRSRHPSYLPRAFRDGLRLAVMPTPDLTTYISGSDLTYDRGTIRGVRKLVLPGTDVSGHGRQVRDGERRVVLTGDWDYTPNADGLRWFVRRVLPDLQRLGPSTGWSVHVYGTGDVDAAADSCQIMGYAERSQELYCAGDIHVAPVPFGGGVKRKVLQPLLSGLPVVTTSAGAHGLRPHPLLDVHDDPRQFASAVAKRLFQQDGYDVPGCSSTMTDRDDTDEVKEWLQA